MTLKGLIFDMDGVLVDTEKFHYLAWKKAFNLKGVHLTKADYAKYCQAQGRHNAIKNMISNPSDKDYEEISTAKAKAYMEAIDQNDIVIYEDARELLKHLETDLQIPLAIASSSVVADYVIQKTYVAWQFSHFITGGMVLRNKPLPDIFNLAADALQIKKENLAVIEDSIAGVIAARLAGINVFALNRNNSLHGLDPINVDIHIKDLNISINQQEQDNVHRSITIPIDDLTDIINYL